MISYFVRYEGRADDLAAFLDHYERVHVPILARWPRLREVHLHTRTERWSDPQPVNAGEVFLLAQLVFDTPEDLQAALASPQREEARADFQRFPGFSGRVIHQAMESRRAHPR